MYDRDLRLAVAKYHASGHTAKETKNVFSVGYSSIKVWTKEYKETGDVKVGYDASNRKPRKIDNERLKQIVEENPHMLQKDIAVILGCKQQGIHDAMKRNKITRKKT